MLQPSSNLQNEQNPLRFASILTSLYRGYKQWVSLYTEQSMHNLNVLQQHCVKDTYPVAL